MAQQRITATELARLFHAASQPVYVLDDEWTIVFVNRACQEWLDVAADSLVGQRCAYHSCNETVGVEAIAAGLCPPPTAMGGWATSGNVSRIAADGSLRYRSATFIPLASAPDDLLALVVLLGREDLAEPPAEAVVSPAEEADFPQLHELIRRFRRQAAVRFRVDGLIGQSTAARLARRQVEVAAASRCSVLVVGPPGCGRQHVAATIHHAGDPEGNGSLIPLACGLLGTDLLGSTVVALASGSPLSENAGRSTLLLSEVDQITPDVQTELAALLIGRYLALRLIATAAQPLAELVRRGRFREDLAAALSTITIELPPLVQRREDLPLLVQLFIEEANAQGGKQIAGISVEAFDRLDAYAWPGNLDELAQAITEAHRRTAGPLIGTGDLPERYRLAAAAAAYPRPVEEKIVLDEFLSRMERELIRRALARSKGNKAKAARLLGLTRPRLYRRMVQLGLVKE